MKLKISGRDYEVCDRCGTFISNPRCLSCFPLVGNEEWIIESLREYYKKDECRIIEEDITKRTHRRPIAPVRHHLLEYFFKRETLIEYGQYYDVPDRFILKVKAREHHRRIGDVILHAYIWEGDQDMKNKLRSDPDYFLERIPKYIYDLFSIDRKTSRIVT